MNDRQINLFSNIIMMLITAFGTYNILCESIVLGIVSFVVVGLYFWEPYAPGHIAEDDL